MSKVEHGFDVYGTPYEPGGDHVASLVQCFNEINSLPAADNPGVKPVSGRFLCKRSGDRLMVLYHLMEQRLDDPARCESFVKDCHRAVGDMATRLKKEFKKRTKEKLTLKEDKGGAGWNREQVNLNGQWYLRVWRTYSVSPESTEPE